MGKLNTRGELELELAAYRAEPENQAVPITGHDPGQKQNFQNFFQKIKPFPLIVQHTKGQPAASTYV